MPAFPSLFRLKLFLLSASLLLAEDKPETDRQRPELRAQRTASRTTTRNLANIPTFSAEAGAISTPLWPKTQTCPEHSRNPRDAPPLAARHKFKKSSQREESLRTTAAEESRQPTNPQPADGENSPRNPLPTHSPVAAKTATQAQDKAVEQGQSLVNALCASCHSTMLVNNARKTGGDWRKTLSKMERQGMPKLPPALRELLVRYLATSLGISDGNLRQNSGPWADRRNANPLW